jgi:hypothetical protein
MMDLVASLSGVARTQTVSSGPVSRSDTICARRRRGGEWGVSSPVVDQARRPPGRTLPQWPLTGRLRSAQPRVWS